jgi:glycosyltransferase involved in cell wall biosynthesis
MRIAVVIPCFKVKVHILDVLAAIPTFISHIIIVDDACPQHTGAFVTQSSADHRIHVHFHQHNQGVGGAMQTGYQSALSLGVDIVVKIDGDGQMDPRLISPLIAPIIAGQADYTKGNRFFNAYSTKKMPSVRMIGNLGISLLSKFSSGYWHTIDPANGFTAIHAKVLRLLPLNTIAKDFFFESDMLFHLSLLRANVKSLPMPTVYSDEISNLSILKTLFTFPGKYLNRFFRRVFWHYFVSQLSIVSLQITFGVFLLAFASIFGGYHWLLSISSHTPATAGTVMLAALAFLFGSQCIIGALAADIANTPKEAIHPQIQ